MTVTVTDSLTGRELHGTEIKTEVDRLDGAATEAPVQIEPWVAKTPSAISPTPTCGRCDGPETGRKPRNPDHELPARSYVRLINARSWPQIPHDALTAHGRAQAEYDSAHYQIQDWRDLAFWAEQEQRKIVSEISGDYRAKRASVESRYDREVGHLHAGLDHAPYAAYVKALPNYVRGNTATVATGQHDDRRVNGRRESQPETPAETPAPRRSWWRNEWVAGAVIVVGWVAIIATMVVLA